MYFKTVGSIQDNRSSQPTQKQPVKPKDFSLSGLVSKASSALRAVSSPTGIASGIANLLSTENKKKVLKGIAEFAQDIPRSAARRALSIGLSTPLGKSFEQDGKRVLDPKQLGIDKVNLLGRSVDILGEKPIESIGTERRRYEQKLGGTTGKVLAPVGVAGMTFLDLAFGSGKAAGLVGKIAKLDDASKITKLVKNFKISENIAEEIIPKLSKITDANTVAKVIKNAEIVSKVEKETGRVLPVALRRGIGEIIEKSDMKTTEEVTKIIDDMTQKIISNVPKGKDEITPGLEGLYALAKKSKSADEFSAKMNKSFEKLQQYEQSGTPLKGKMADVYLETKKYVTENNKPIEFRDIFNRSKKIERDALAASEELKSKELVDTGIKIGKRIGKKVGTFQEKAKQRQKVVEIYKKFRNKKETLGNFERAARQYSDDLPIAIKRRIRSTVKFGEITTGKRLNKILDTIDSYRSKINEEGARRYALTEANNLAKTAREKGINIIKALNDAGINNKKSIKTSSRVKLEKLRDGIKELLDTTPPARKNVDFGKIDVSNKRMSKARQFGRSFARSLERGFGSASTSIRKYGGDALLLAKKGGIRGRRYEIFKESNKAKEGLEGFVKGLRKIEKKFFNKKKDFKTVWYSLYNQDFDTARSIFKKYGIEDEFKKVISVLDDVRKRANEVGIKVGKLENYFPRIVADYEGLFDAYNKKFGNKGRSYLDKILASAAKAKGVSVDSLTIEERGEALTKALRGYGERINVGGAGKARAFKDLDPEFLKFYHTPEESLIRYVSNMNDKIATKRILGKDDVTAESIGSLVDGLNLSYSDAQNLKEVLTTVLSPQGKENSLFNMLRKSATLTLLGNLQSTITNLADIAPSIYKFGLGRAVVSLFRKKPHLRDKMLADISVEFKDANVITKVLKATGFDKVDQIMSESFMGNSFRNSVKLARKSEGKEYKEWSKRVSKMFGKDAEKVINDFKAGVVNDDTAYVAFNDLLDISPRAIEELPEYYIKHPNARMFYALKSWSLKIIDVYRNDVIRKFKEDPKQATKNFIKLTSVLALSGATTDQLKEWWSGKDDGETFGDKIVANIFKIAMATKYDVSNTKKDGLGRAIINKIAPPTRLIDDITKDLFNPSPEGSYAVRNIPIVGKELYDRFGRGSKKKESASDFTKRMKGSTREEKIAELEKLKNTNPSKYRSILKEYEWQSLKITDTERELYKLNVYDGSRAKAIIKYIKKSKNKASTYDRLRKSGIISDDVADQMRYLMKNVDKNNK